MSFLNFYSNISQFVLLKVPRSMQHNILNPEDYILFFHCILLDTFIRNPYTLAISTHPET